MPGDSQDEVAETLYPDTARRAVADTVTAELAAPWEPPIPLGTVTVPDFPISALPKWMGEFVEAEARATQTPPDLTAMLALSVCAAACAQRVAIQLKDGYVEPANVFTVTVLPPGNRKSAVFRDVLLPLVEYERDEAAKMAPTIAQAHSRLRMAEEALGLVEKQAARATPDARGKLETEALALALEVGKIKVPTSLRLVVDDCSSEALATLICQQGGRIAVLAPEGDVFDMMAGRYSSTGMSNFGTYLRGHAGDPLRIDRVQRPDEFVSAAALTVGLTVQPEVLRGLVARPGFRGRGLLGRFLYSLPKSTLGYRDVDAPPVPVTVSSAYWRGMHRLLSLQPVTDDAGAARPNLLTLEPAARARFREFEKWIEPQLAEFGTLGHVTDWAGKLAGAVGRLTAILHVAGSERPDAWMVPVAASTVESAITIGKYLIPHALAAFGEMGADPDVERARQLWSWIVGMGADSFTKRDAYQAMKGRFKRVVEMGPAITVLTEHGYIRERVQPGERGPGRPASPTYDVNPLARSRQVQDPWQQAPVTHSEDCGDSGNGS